MSVKRFVVAVSVACGLLVLAGCGGPNTTVTSGHDLAGFTQGLWDGGTSLFAFVAALFGADCNIYEIYNNGNWYNLGFLTGVGVLGGATNAVTNAFSD